MEILDKEQVAILQYNESYDYKPNKSYVNVLQGKITYVFNDVPGVLEALDGFATAEGGKLEQVKDVAHNVKKYILS